MTKILSLLVYPLSQSLLGFLLALLLRPFPRLSVGLLLLSFAWLYLCSTSLLADFLMGSLEETYRPRSVSAIPAADAIVLLGGGTRGDTHLSSMADLNAHADRIPHALRLYKAGKAPLVVITGGSATGSRPEAEQIRDYLELMGMPRRHLLLERQSRNTEQNARYSAVLLKPRGVKKILLVTSAFHMRRAVPLFERQGFEVIPAPTDYQRLVGRDRLAGWLPTVESLYRSTLAIREYVGYLYYRARGWL